jgi:hypothetical protein
MPEICLNKLLTRPYEDCDLDKPLNLDNSFELIHKVSFLVAH